MKIIKKTIKEDSVFLFLLINGTKESFKDYILKYADEKDGEYFKGTSHTSIIAYNINNNAVNITIKHQYSPITINITKKTIRNELAFMYVVNKNKYPGITMDLFRDMVHNDINQAAGVYTYSDDNFYKIIAILKENEDLYQTEDIDI